MLDWLVIGGGVHGIHVAVSLLRRARTPLDRLGILDPFPDLLTRWRHCTANTGMTWLRSPAVHHLDVGPYDLVDYGRRAPGGKANFSPPYDRPSLALFNTHAQAVIERHGLPGCHRQGRAERIHLTPESVRVETSSGVIEAQRALLAIGLGDQTDWPPWAEALRSSGRLHHLFDDDFSLATLAQAPPQPIAVLGGGISAAQAAVQLAQSGHTVTLLRRHDLRTHTFDADPGWQGPRNMRIFEAESDLGRRRALITEARHRGSLPPDVLEILQKSPVSQRETTVMGATATPEGLSLELADDTLCVGHLVLATGFRRERPGGALLTSLIEDANLPCAACGFPIVDRHLRWHPRLVVTGSLAELELGPVARNISGARRAAERIIPLTSPPLGRVVGRRKAS